MKEELANMHKEERLKYLDIIRCIAICCVIMCHSIEGGIYSFSVEYLKSIELNSKLFAFVMFGIGRMGVPFFLFISGYLLLDKTYTDDMCKIFWKKKCIALLISIEFWLLFYNIFLYFFNGTEVSIIGIIKEMLFLNNSSMNHMWYMPMILGMYITIPLAANALHSIKIKVLIIPYCVALICFACIPTANNFFELFGVSVGNTVLSAGFSGGLYGVYLVTGYLLRQGVLKKINTKILGCCAVGCFLGTVVMQLILYQQNYILWYNNIFLFVCCTCCFELLTRLKRVYFERLQLAVAKYSFAIYLIHNMIVMILKRYSEFIEISSLRVCLVWLCSAVLSLLLSMMISKIPKVGKIILYMK